MKPVHYRVTKELYDLLKQQKNESIVEVITKSLELFQKNPVVFTEEEKILFLKVKREKILTFTIDKDLKKLLAKNEKIKHLIIDYSVRKYVESKKQVEPNFEEEEIEVEETPADTIDIEFEKEKEELDELFFDPGLIDLKDLIIYICDYCNMDCKHCYLKKGSDTVKPEWIQWLINNFDFEKSIIVGGEPTICPALPDIVKILKEKNINVVISTNCKWIEKPGDLEKMLHALKDVDRIQISIEGREKINDMIRAPGSYKNAINTVKLLKEKKFEVAFRMTYSQWNLAEVPYILELAVNMGIQVDLFPYKGDDIMPLTAEQQEWLYNMLINYTSDNGKRLAIARIPQFLCYLGEWDYCPAGNQRICVLPDGLITPCEMSVPPSHFPLARFKNNDKNNCMDKEFLLKRIRFFLNNIKIPDVECSRCKFYHFCRSGCLQTKEYMNCPLKEQVNINYYREDLGISQKQIRTRVNMIVKNVAERIGC